MLAIASFFMLSRSGKKEGIDFKHNKWIFLDVYKRQEFVFGYFTRFI